MNMPRGEAVAVDPQFGVGVPPKQEVTFADGSALWLHRVSRSRAPLFERRVTRPDGSEAARIDLRDLAPDLAEDLPITATRDVPGTVWFSLRLRFKSAEQLLTAAEGRLQ